MHGEYGYTIRPDRVQIAGNNVILSGVEQSLLV
jgi:hypothetical protein